MQLWQWCLIVLLMSFSSSIVSKAHNKLSLQALSKPNLILIIDDLGDNYRIGKRVIQLPAQLNIAILPHTPFAEKLAKMAHTQGHEIMLHCPMESSVKDAKISQGVILEKHNQDEVQSIFRHNIKSIPYVKGFNNHMGSHLTRFEKPMSWLLASAHYNGLYFIDSRTNRNTKAYDIAKRFGIKTLRRDIFLDPDSTNETINKQLKKVFMMGKKYQTIVVIAHPYDNTLAILEQSLDKLSKQFNIIKISDYFNRQSG